jgi:hypothetical protein
LAFIDEAIAVVVLCVACFANGSDFAFARVECARFAMLDTCHAAPHVGAARAHHELVDGTIAVFVDSITCLAARKRLTCTGAPFTVFALLHARATRARVVATYTMEGFIDAAIAIFVGSIARFSAWTDGTFACGSTSSGAALDARHAFTKIGAARDIGIAIDAFTAVVWCAIAVFIGTGGIADLGLFEDITRAVPPRAKLEPLANHLTIGATAETAGSWIATEASGDIARSAWTTVVDLAVAIVIEAVAADFVDRAIEIGASIARSIARVVISPSVYPIATVALYRARVVLRGGVDSGR